MLFDSFMPVRTLMRCKHLAATLAPLWHDYFPFQDESSTSLFTSDEKEFECQDAEILKWLQKKIEEAMEASSLYWQVAGFMRQEIFIDKVKKKQLEGFNYTRYFIQCALFFVSCCYQSEREQLQFSNIGGVFVWKTWCLVLISDQHLVTN